MATIPMLHVSLVLKRSTFSSQNSSHPTGSKRGKIRDQNNCCHSERVAITEAHLLLLAFGMHVPIASSCRTWRQPMALSSRSAGAWFVRIRLWGLQPEGATHFPAHPQPAFVNLASLTYIDLLTNQHQSEHPPIHPQSAFQVVCFQPDCDSHIASFCQIRLW